MVRVNSVNKVLSLQIHWVPPRMSTEMQRKLLEPLNIANMVSTIIKCVLLLSSE